MIQKNIFDRNDHKKNWFSNVAINTGIAVGGYWGFNKFGGPVKRALDNINKTIISKEIDKQLAKTSDMYDVRSLINPETSEYQKLSGNHLKYDNEKVLLTLNNKLDSNIRINERKMTVEIRKALKKSNENRKVELFDQLIKDKTFFHDTFIKDVQNEALKKFAQTYSHIDKNKLAHESLLVDDVFGIRYKETYLALLRNKVRFCTHDLDDVIRKSGITGIDAIDNIKRAYRTSRYIKTPTYKKETFKFTPEEMVKSSELKTFTSVPFVESSKRLQQMDPRLNIDYIPAISDLDKTLYDLSERLGTITQNGKTINRLGFGGTSISSSSRGHLKVHELIIPLSIDGKDFKLTIPLSQNNILPGRSLMDAPSIDRIIEVTRLGKEGSFLTNYSLENIKQTKLMLETFISREMSGVNPNGAKIISKIQQRIDGVYSRLSRLNGPALRSIVQATAVETRGDPTKIVNTARKEKELELYRIHAEQTKLLKRISGEQAENTLIVYLDFETLSAGMLGDAYVANQVKFADTKIYRAGLVVSECGKSRKGKVLSTIDLANYNTIAEALKYKTLSKENISWIKNVTGEKDETTAINKFVSELHNMHENQKSNKINIQSNEDMIATLRKFIIDLRKSTGKNIVLAGKNIRAFDLKLVNLHDRAFSDVVDGIYDIEIANSIRQRNTELPESKKIEELMYRLMSPHGVSKADISTNPLKVFTIAERLGFLILDQQTKDVLSKNSALAAHSPMIDSLYTKMLLGSESLDDPIYSTLAMEQVDSFLGYRSMSRSIDKATKEEGRLVGGQRVSRSIASSNIAAKHLMSFTNISDALIFPNSDPTKQWDQLYSGNRIKVSSAEQYAFNRFKSGAKMNRGEFRRISKWVKPIKTRTMALAEDFISDAQMIERVYSNHLVAKTTLIYNAFGGTGGQVSVSSNFMKDVQVEIFKKEKLSKFGLNGEPQLAAELDRMYVETIRVAKQIAGGDNISLKEIYAAANQVANDPKFSVKLSSGEKYNVGHTNEKKFVDINFNGKVERVLPDVRGTGNIIGYIVEMAGMLNGDYFADNGFKLRSAGFKAQALVLDPKQIAGGADIQAGFEALEKGWAGSLKTLVLEDLIHNLRLKIDDPHISIAEKKLLKRQLKEVMSKTGLSWYKNQIVKNKSKAGQVSKMWQSQLNTAEDKAAASHMLATYFGDVDVQLEDLMKFSKYGRDKTELWTKESINDFYKTVGGREKYKSEVQRQIDEGIKQIEESMTNKENVVNFLKGTNISKVIDDYRMMSQRLFIPKVGERKFLQAIQMQSDSSNYVLGWNGYVSCSMNGIADGLHARNTLVKIKKGNLVNLDHPGSSISKSFLDYIRNHEVYLGNAKYAEVRNKLSKFLSMELADHLTTGKDLTLDELELVLGRVNQEKIKTLVRVRRMSQFDEKEIRESLKHLNKTALDKEVAKIRDTHSMAADFEAEQVYQRLKTSPYNKMYGGGSTEYKYQMPSYMQQMAGLADKHKGMFILNYGEVSGGTLEIDLLHTLEKMGKSGKESTRLMNDLLARFKQMKTAVDASKTGKTIEIINDRIIKMSHLIMPAYEHEGLISKDAGLGIDEFVATASEDTLFKRNIVDEMLQIRKLSKQNTTTGVVKEKASNIASAYIKLMIGSHADMLAAGGDFLVPGTAGKHISVEKVFDNARMLEKARRGVSAEDKEILSRMLRSSVDTVFVTSETFHKMSVTDELGKEINFARDLEKNLGSDYYESLLKGKHTIFGGGIVRYPITQSGYNGMFNTKLMVIHDELAKRLGMNKNTFFAHSLMTEAFKADNDGDDAYLIMRSIKSIQHHDSLRKESADSLQTILNDTSFKSRLAKMRSKYASIKRGSSGTFVTTYNINDQGMGEFIDTPIKDFSLSNILSGANKVVTDLVGHAPENLSLESATSWANKSAMALVSKEWIGEVTNLTTSRIMDLMKMGGLTDPVKKLVIGNINFGLSGFSQHVIALAKHSKDTAKLAKAFSFLKNFNPKDKDGFSAFHDIWMEGGEVGGIEKGSAEWQSLSDTAYLIADKGHAIDKIKRLDVKFSDANRHAEDIMIGRKRLSELDFALADSNPDLFQQQLNDMLVQSMVPEYATDSVGGLKEAVMRKFKIGIEDIAKSKKIGKAGLLGAGIFLAANLFSPTYYDTSSSAMGHVADFSDLQRKGLELPRSVKLGLVDASFSKDAFVQLNDIQTDTKKAKAEINTGLLKNVINPDFYKDFSNSNRYTYADYTKYVGSFGAKGNIYKRINYI